MASVARSGFNACKGLKKTGAQGQQVRWSGAMQAVKIRMKSVQNIAKITKAMQMVAASKLRGAEQRVKDARPFTGAMKDIFGSIAKSEENPDGVEFNSKSECVIPVTSDKGLCGGVNTVIVKLVRLKVLPELKAAGVDVKLVCVGDKGRSVLRRNNAEDLTTIITQCFAGIPPNFSVAACIAGEALATDTDGVTIAYNVFKSAVTQIPTVIKVPTYKLIAEGAEEDPFVNFETEDERGEVLESFAEFNLAVTLYGAMLENNCSEVASRMAAMDNATRNAQDAYNALELKYNKARQASITTELIEIISGAESLKG